MNYKPTLTLLCGLPASGKSTYAQSRANENTIVLSSDKLRLELLGDECCQTNNELVFNTLHKRAKEYLLNGKNAIIDACNINRKDRRRTLVPFQGMDIYRECLVVPTLPKICLKNDMARSRSVGKEVINKFLYKFESPMCFEGFDGCGIAYNDCNRNSEFSVVDELENATDFNQHNPHHTLTLGEHCNYCGFLVADNVDLTLIASLHDIGKLYTQTFDENGVAHYFSHENVGAYYCLCSKEFENDYLTWKDIFYINYHMLPFSLNAQKTRDKYRELFGDELFDNLMILHECDKIASGTYE